MTFASILQIVSLDPLQKGISARTKKPYEVQTAQCLLLNENGGVEQTGRMRIPDEWRPTVREDVYSVGFTLSVAQFGENKGLLIPRFTSLTSLSSGVMTAPTAPGVQVLQILRLDEPQTGTYDNGRDWVRQNAEVMLLEKVGNEFKPAPAGVGRMNVPEAFRDVVKVGAFSCAFALDVPTYGSTDKAIKAKHEVTARLTGLTPIQGGFRVGLPKSAPAARPAASEAVKA